MKKLFSFLVVAICMVTATGFAVKDDHKKSLNAKAEFEAIDAKNWANYQKIRLGSSPCTVTCHVAAVPIGGEAKNNCIMPDGSFDEKTKALSEGGALLLRI